MLSHIAAIPKSLRPALARFRSLGTIRPSTPRKPINGYQWAYASGQLQSHSQGPANRSNRYSTGAAGSSSPMSLVKPLVIGAVVILGGYFAYGFLFGDKSVKSAAHDVRRAGEDVRDVAADKYHDVKKELDKRTR